MASKALLLLCLNLAFFTLVTSNYVPVPSPPPPPSGYNPGGPNDGHNGGHHDGHHDGHHGGSSTPVPTTGGKCPKDALKIQACASVLNGLNGLAKAVVGPQRAKCCSLLDGIVGLDAGVCLCTTLTTDVLGLHLKVPVSVNALLNFCNKAGVPANFQCPNY